MSEHMINMVSYGSELKLPARSRHMPKHTVLGEKLISLMSSFYLVHMLHLDLMLFDDKYGVFQREHR